VNEGKVVHALWRPEGVAGDVFSKTLLAELGPRLSDAGASAVQVNVSDEAVAGATLRITTFPTPVDAVVSVWLPSRDVAAVTRTLSEVAGHVEGWFVEEESPLPPPVVPLGERQPGLANVAFLRRPEGLPYARWLDLWKNHHTAVAIETQATFGYVQNRVVGPATDGASAVHAIVEELFPIEALTDVHAFYGSGGDEDELARRLGAMLRSVTAFGADRDIDVVPTSRYQLV
jgi:hypothetical protein